MIANELPALLGGPPACPAGPPPWPIADEDVRQALVAAYASGSWGKYHGDAVPRLETALAAYHGIEFALTCGSGTYAVELALRALKIGPGDEVIQAAYDYPGNFLTSHALGAIPVLADVAPHNWNLDPANIEAAVSDKTRAVLVSHLHGGVVPMREVMEIARRRGLSVIEDAAQMPGAKIQGRLAGTWGHVGVLSFGGSKLLTAGRGGAIITARADIHQRARVAAHRGNTVCPISELQAAVLLPQLAKMDERNAERARNVQTLLESLSFATGLHPFKNLAGDATPGYYKLGFQFDEADAGLSRSRFVAAVQAEGVALDEGFKGLHVGRAPSRYRTGGPLTEASRAHAGTLVLHHPVLLGPATSLGEVAAAFRKVYANLGRLRG